MISPRVLRHVVAGVLFGSASLACSGASSIDPIGAPTATAAATEPAVAQGDAETWSTTSASGEADDAAAPASDEAEDAGEHAPPPPEEDAGSPAPDPDAGPVVTPDAGPPPRLCSVEKEPNDGPAEATRFVSCLLGELSSTRDVDLVRLDTPAGAHLMRVRTSGSDARVVFRVAEADGSRGQPVPVAVPDAVVTVLPSTGYTFEVAANNRGVGSKGPSEDEGSLAYVLEVSFE